METAVEIFGKLGEGIYFEDTKSFLYWNTDLKKLISDNSAKIISKADRTIINWGTHTILYGLNLDLSNTYLLNYKNSNSIFNSIEYKCVGDRIANEMFDKISDHLINLIGEPKLKEDFLKIENGKNYIWEIEYVEIRLYLFEQHAYKLSFSINCK